MTVHIRLHQEGFQRTTGYQATQWIATVPPDVTTPLTYAEIFVIRNFGGFEAFDHISTPLEMTNLPFNELKYFEARGATGGTILGALPGDILRVTTSVPHWIESAAPYLNQDFPIAGIAAMASGSAPVMLPGSQLQLPGYVFTDADIGRWVTLTGFTLAGYNTTVAILSYVGDTATIAMTTSILQTGSAWTIRRLLIETNAGPTVEKRYFPTLERRLSWEVRRGLSTIVASGTEGYPQRELPTAQFFRSQRLTTVEATLEDAQARFAVVQNAVMNLQLTGDRIGTTFLNPQNYDYPPL